MIQTGLIQSAHSDLVTHASYDFYGLRLATCGLDQRSVYSILFILSFSMGLFTRRVMACRIKIWALDEPTSTWTVEDDWKAHDAAVSRLSWAHPEFGNIIVSSSFDRTVKVWEQTATGASSVEPGAQVNGHHPSPGGQGQGPGSRWVERAVLLDARGTVRAVEFAPHHFGLKFVCIPSTMNYVCSD
jgi:nucleoporin SEH1